MSGYAGYRAWPDPVGRARGDSFGVDAVYIAHVTEEGKPFREHRTVDGGSNTLCGIVTADIPPTNQAELDAGYDTPDRPVYYDHDRSDVVTCDECFLRAWQSQSGDDFDEVRMLQSLIDRGTWGLEGSMGRAMMQAIESGACMLGPEPARDYWGNRIPSRYEVQTGTKGSAAYCVTILKERGA